MYRKNFKRVLDIITSFFGLVLLFPILVITTFLLAITNQGKPFFFQTRPGKNEKLFNIIKFKTMTDTTDVNGNLLSDAERMTKIGSFVRKTSLDELPQLINVLLGDMSIIGPRPLLPRYLTLYSDFQNRRHEVKPGITGWAQINGRNTISWAKKFEYDVWYVDHISILVDIKILLLTVQKVFIREGIHLEGQATTEAFTGNN
jgi:lipopolysaccharide/colanic/teichoic acid biosynthesis glycosyltransferase|tara:strand:+ start:645 stop:1250 length:606 start_codon:yes stop_codon:yes gene_type:complete